jgi:hypothetical protein
MRKCGARGGRSRVKKYQGNFSIIKLFEYIIFVYIFKLINGQDE